MSRPSFNSSLDPADRAARVSLGRDDLGIAKSAELIILTTALAIGLLVAFSTLRDSVTAELSDVVGATQEINDSYLILGTNSHSGSTAGAGFSDDVDFCDTPGATPGEMDNCIRLSDPIQEGEELSGGDPGGGGPGGGDPGGSSPLRVRHFALNNPSSLNDLDTNATPIFEEELNRVGFDVGRGAAFPGGPTDNFGVVYDGRFSVDTAGDHTFYLGSDDGSALYIDGQLVIGNDRLQAVTERRATINLSAGPHTIEVRYFERTGLAELYLDWSSNTFARTPMQFD